jgi:sulfite exporter TauE/SafE
VPAESAMELSLGALIFAAFLAGLVGSPHCAVMCGPLVVGCLRADGGRSLVWQQCGRLLGYALLGAMAGLFSSTLADVLPESAVRVVPLTFGAILVALALVEIVPPRGPVASMRRRVHGGLGALLRSFHRATAAAPAALRPWLLGAASIALPCGLLHAITLTAAGSGSPERGILVLTAFFAGTLPALAILGFTAGRFAAWRTAPAWLRAAALLFAGASLIHAGSVARSCCSG